jgi:hypothetical protein
MVRVTVSTLSPLEDNRWSYHVEVTESGGSGSQTRHKVSTDKEYYEKISTIPNQHNRYLLGLYMIIHTG